MMHRQMRGVGVTHFGWFRIAPKSTEIQNQKKTKTHSAAAADGFFKVSCPVVRCSPPATITTFVNGEGEQASIPIAHRPVPLHTSINEKLPNQRKDFLCYYCSCCTALDRSAVCSHTIAIDSSFRDSTQSVCNAGAASSNVDDCILP